MPTFGSLFAGIGGIDLGLERAGWTCRWQVEWDAWCQRVLAKHWPDVPRYGDITAVDWNRVERVDLLAGGFPCQPVSGAGRQKAQADERWLWPEFLRAIRGLRPGVVLVENVTNLLAVNAGSAFGDVLGDLAESGYDAEWDCIPAASVGALHDRDRVWIVAHPNGRNGRAWRQGRPEYRRERLPKLPYLGATEPMANSDSRGRGTERRPGDGREMGSRRGHPADASTAQNGRALADSDDQGSQGHWRLHRERDGSGERSAWPSSWTVERSWLPEPDVGRVAHGVPSRVDRLRGLGNAVVPQVAEVIGRRLLESL